METFLKRKIKIKSKFPKFLDFPSKITRKFPPLCNPPYTTPLLPRFLVWFAVWTSQCYLPKITAYADFRQSELTDFIENCIVYDSHSLRFFFSFRLWFHPVGGTCLIVSARLSAFYQNLVKDHFGTLWKSQLTAEFGFVCHWGCMFLSVHSGFAFLAKIICNVALEIGQKAAS